MQAVGHLVELDEARRHTSRDAALRRDRVDHEHFQVPSVVPVLGVGVSIALLTQIEADAYLRAAILVGIGSVLWLINEFFVRRGDRAAAA